MILVDELKNQELMKPFASNYESLGKCQVNKEMGIIVLTFENLWGKVISNKKISIQFNHTRYYLLFFRVKFIGFTTWTIYKKKDFTLKPTKKLKDIRFRFY
jgi:hypothetical protein